jgi:hypothetical protein
MDTWPSALITLLQFLNELLTAGIAITAIGLLLYALAFNLRDRVARSFALILMCVVIVFTADTLGSTNTQPLDIEVWLRIQWVGIIILPATYLHFSDALLATTGKPSRGKRRWAIRFSYLVSAVFLLILPTETFLGNVQLVNTPAPYLQRTFLTDIFTAYYIILMALSWYNFARAYRRTTTTTSQRRMIYLVTGALAPAFGSFPFLLFSSEFASQHPLLFWAVAFLSNLMVSVMLVIMAYAVAFFGVSWTDRVVKARLFKWLMRGPFTASIALGLTTLVRRVSESLGYGYNALVPLTVVGSILLLEYLITLFAPLGERFLFDGDDHSELEVIRNLEARLLTRNDLNQFLEMVLAAACDRTQAPGAYILAGENGGFELVAKTGFNRFLDAAQAKAHLAALADFRGVTEPFSLNGDFLLPLSVVQNGQSRQIGLMGITNSDPIREDDDLAQALGVLTRRAVTALGDRITQQQVFQAMFELSPQVDMIQSLRAAGRFDDKRLLDEDVPVSEEMVIWVKDALTHYWGGPKLTDSPLLKFQVVEAALAAYEGNGANALRSVLKEAIERLRPEGERRYTAEWILYNILDLKFLEGRKVRDIAIRLAMSEADLYRKQRVAIDMVARELLELEAQARKQK